MKASTEILGASYVRLMVHLFACVTCCLLAGCASAPKETQGSDGTVYKRTKNFDKLWIAEGFDFTGHDSILVAPIKSEVQPKDDKERSRLETAQQAILNGLTQAIRTNHIGRRWF